MARQVNKLYNGTVTLYFNEKARNRYMLEDDHSPVGVTTVLQTLNKPALMTWPMHEAIDYLKKHPEDYEGAEKAYLKKSDAGKDTGTAIHFAVETFLNDQIGGYQSIIVPKHPDAGRAYSSFVDWYRSQKIRPLAVEQVVYSMDKDFAGTYDCLLEIDGQTVLCDLKTTNVSRSAPKGIYAEMFLQLGAYSLAHHEENPLETIEDLMVIRVGKDGIVYTLRASQISLSVKDCEQAFTKVLGAYRFMTPLSKQLQEEKV